MHLKSHLIESKGRTDYPVWSDSNSCTLRSPAVADGVLSGFSGAEKVAFLLQPEPLLGPVPTLLLSGADTACVSPQGTPRVPVLCVSLTPSHRTQSHGLWETSEAPARGLWAGTWPRSSFSPRDSRSDFCHVGAERSSGHIFFSGTAQLYSAVAFYPLWLCNAVPESWATAQKDTPVYLPQPEEPGGYLFHS